MASTPFWWDYTTSSIFTDDVMETYLNIGKFVDTLPLSTTSFERQEQLRDDAYIYTLQNDTMAFGWGWRIDSEFISGVPLNINNLNTGSYQLAWFNTWSGEFEQINSVTSVASTLSATVFDMPVPERDIAFRITPIENGDTPYKINFIVPEEGFVAAKTPIEYKLPVYLTDRSGRLAEASVEINLSATGNGHFTQNTITTQQGIAYATFVSTPGEGALVNLLAEASGLESAIVTNVVVTGREQEEQDDLPTAFKLEQNYPNPFNPATVIRYHLPVTSHIKLEVFNSMGQHISTLQEGMKTRGSYEITFNASGLASGVYFYRLEAGNVVQVQRMVLIK